MSYLALFFLVCSIFSLSFIAWTYTKPGKSGLRSYNPMEYTINIKGRLMDLSTPQVMGILNVTPDSSYSGSRKQTEMEIAQRANQIVEEGGSIIDVGAFSTRPGADEVSEEEEGRRLKFALDIVRREQPDAAVSVDTYRPTLARKCIEEWGADIINDVSEGGITGIANVPLEQRQEEYPEMFRVVGELKVPYILMSVQPTLETMMKGFAKEVQQLRDLGSQGHHPRPGLRLRQESHPELSDL